MNFDKPGNIIRVEMTRCGFTMETLSEATQISQAVLQGILNSRTETISTRNLCALARQFGYSASDFIDLLSGKSKPGSTEK